MLKIFPNIYFAGGGFTGSKFDASASGIGMVMAVILEQGVSQHAASRAVAGAARMQ